MGSIKWTALVVAALGLAAIVHGVLESYEMAVVLALVAIAWAVLSLNES